MTLLQKILIGLFNSKSEKRLTDYESFKSQLVEFMYHFNQN
jgi:hypothetical protein